MSPPTPILHCRPRFRLECPRDWDALTPTADARIRHCDACARAVHLCADEAELTARARRGECVAAAFIADGDAEPEMIVGEYLVPPLLSD